MSKLVSVTPGTSDTFVSKITREPSLEAASKNALMAALPPPGPIEICSFRLWFALALAQAQALANARMAMLRQNTRAFRFTSISPRRPGYGRKLGRQAPLNTSAPPMSSPLAPWKAPLRAPSGPVSRLALDRLSRANLRKRPRPECNMTSESGNGFLELQRTHG